MSVMKKCLLTRGLWREIHVISASMKPGAESRPPSVALAAIVVFGILYGNFLVQYAWRNWQVLNVDLPSFHLASRLAFHDEVSPYDRGAFLAQGPAYNQHIFPFLYPPPSLLWFWPIAGVPYRVVATVFLVLQHILLLLWLWLACRFSQTPTKFGLPWLIASGLLACYPVVNTFLHGQVNLLTGVLLLAAGLGYVQGRTGLTAIPLVGAILLKQSPVVFLLLLVLRQRWKALAATVLLLGAATLASVAFLPAEAWRDWLAEVRPTLGYGKVPLGLFSPSCAYNQSLNGAVARFFLPAECGLEQEVPTVGRFITAFLAAVVMGASLFSLWRRRTRSGLAADTRDFALFLPLGFLLSPLSWLHHLVIVLPAAVVALRDAHEARSRSRFWGVSAATLLMGVDVPVVDFAALPHGLGLMMGSLPTVAVLGLTLALSFPPAKAEP
jgi:hypothetical protein